MWDFNEEAESVVSGGLEVSTDALVCGSSLKLVFYFHGSLCGTNNSNSFL